MAMPGGGGMGPMPPQPMMSPHQQMVAQQHQQAAVVAAAAAAAAAAQAQQGHPMMPTGMGGGPIPPGGPGSVPGQIPGQPHPAVGGPPGPGSQGPPGGPPGQPNPGAPGGPPTQEQARVDNISKAKALIPNLKESMFNVMRTTAMTVSANNMIDSGTKQVEYDVSRFDKALEEFISLSDQLEVHLKTSIECLNQASQSGKYLPIPVGPNKTDNMMTYPQYIDVVKGQIAYAKDIHGTLTEASQRLSE